MTDAELLERSKKSVIEYVKKHHKYHGVELNDAIAEIEQCDTFVKFIRVAWDYGEVILLDYFAEALG